MKTEIKVDRFFEDKDFKKLVNLTQEEAKAISDFETGFENANGFRGISGGFAFIILEDFDEDSNNIIVGHLKSGIQDGCENSVYTDQIEFYRSTKEIEIV